MKELKLTQQENQLLRNALYGLRKTTVEDFEKENLNNNYVNIDNKVYFIEMIIDIDKLIHKLEELNYE